MDMITKDLMNMPNKKLMDVAETFNWELRASRKEIAQSNTLAWIDEAYILIDSLIDRIGDLNDERYEMEAIINQQVRKAIVFSSVKIEGNS
jgi:hypothetical protein